MARPIIDPTDDLAPPDRVGNGADNRPRGEINPKDPTLRDSFVILSESGNAIPPVWGTARVGLQVLERYPYSIGSQTNKWLPNNAYALNDVVVSNGNIYVCTVGGTSFLASYTLGAAAIASGGGGYAVNDTIDLAGGFYDPNDPNNQAQLKVTGVSVGAITTFTINRAGKYSRLPPNAAVGQQNTSGGGSGATFNLTWNPAGGPFSTLDDIAGGITLRWKFLYPASTRAGTANPWKPSTAYVIGNVVASQGYLYYCITAGTSSATGSLGNGPTGQQRDITDGTVHWSYIEPGYIIPAVLGICEGPIYGISGAWQDALTLGNYQSISHPGNLMQLELGTPTGFTRPTWITTPDALADKYSNTALLALQYLSAGGDGSMPNLSLEVAGVFCDATHVDVSPCDIAIDILTHTRRGIGWPSARVDALSTGAGTASSWRNYCTAFGFNLSLALDSQKTVLEILALLLKATNTDCVQTNRPDGLGWMLKFVPRGDAALTANGVTFTPDLTATAIGPDDLLEPIQVNVRRPTDRMNSFPVEFVERGQGYRKQTVDDPDMADVDQRGLRRAPTTSIAPVVLAPASAVQLSRIYAQRSLKVRNTYTLRLPWKYLRLEPTDLLSVSDPVFGLVNERMRIISIDEQNAGDGSFTVTAEEWQGGVHVASTTVLPQLASPAAMVPVQQTALAQADVGPRNIGTTSIVADRLSITNFSNLFPNHNSEASPAPGVLVLDDGNSPEFDFRFNAGTASAHTGTWVRRLSKTATGVDDVTLKFRATAAEGQQYRFEVWGKWITTSGAASARVFIKYFDGAGTEIATGNVSSITGASWFSLRGTKKAPTGTASVELWVNLHFTGAGTADIYFDDIQFFRGVDMTFDSSGAVYAFLRQSVNVAINDNTVTLVPFNGADFDSDSAVTVGASAKFSVPTGKAGPYRISASITLDGAGTVTSCYIAVFKNGAEEKRFGRKAGAQGVTNMAGTALVQGNEGDYFDIRVFHSGSAAAKNIVNGSPENYFTIERVSGVAVPNI